MQLKKIASACAVINAVWIFVVALAPAFAQNAATALRPETTATAAHLAELQTATGPLGKVARRKSSPRGVAMDSEPLRNSLPSPSRNLGIRICGAPSSLGMARLEKGAVTFAVR